MIGKRAVLAGDLEQALRLQPLLPERRPLARTPPWDQQRSACVLAEARAEQRAGSELAHHELLDLVRVDDQLVDRRSRVGVGKVESDPVVGPERLHLEAERIPQPRSDRHRPGRVHAGAERRQDADAPVADLVAEALDDDGPIRGHGTGRGLLVAEEGHQVLRRLLVQRVVFGQPRDRLRLRQGGQLAGGLADRLAELVRPTRPFSLPERDRPRNTRSRRDEHTVAGDLLDPPRGGAEHERLARARFVDHLLVELPDPPAAVHEMNAVETPVGDRARIRDRELAGSAAASDHACGAVPDDPGPQLGELVRRVAAGEHVEDVLELDAREVGEVVGAAYEVVQLVDGDLLVGADGHDLLGEHVERVARDDGLLDRARPHAFGDDCRLEQVGAELREDPSAGDGAELVARAADPLEAARDRLRRLDLDHEVDGAHVDAELERRRGDEARDLAHLEELLDLDPLFARERPVVGTRDLLTGRALLDVLVRQLVQAQREPLGQAAVVDEDDRRAVLLDELQDLGVDRRPDRVRLARLAHVLERDDDFQVELLRAPCVHQLDRPPAGDEPPDLLHRPLRGRQADPLDRLLGEAVEPLDGERKVSAPLRPGHRVHLVEDQRLDALQHLASARGQQQVQRLRCRDQDVRVVPQHRRAVALRRVAGANGHAELRVEPRERPAQVALDVVVQSLQRRDVEEPEPLARLRGEPVDPVEKGRQRLPGAGGSLDERVLPARDRRPAQLLRGGRSCESSFEPGSCSRARRRRARSPVQPSQRAQLRATPRR